MKKIFLFSLLSLLPNLIFAQAGSLDSSFNSNGKRISSLSASNDRIGDLILQPNQHIVTVGNNGSLLKSTILRYKPNGAHDSTMGTDGIATSPLPMISTSGLLQPDGKIVVGGYTSNYAFALTRHMPNGSVDSSFGTNGMVSTSITNNVLDICLDVELQADGKIIAFGTTDAAGISDMAMVRYNPSGSVDSTFGDNGIVIKDIGTNTDDGMSAGVIQTDGKIIVVGSSTQQNLYVIRFLNNGNIDSAFGTNGILITNIYANSNNSMQNVRLQNNGKIVLAGWCTINATSPQEGFLIRLNSNGSLDNSFGSNGIVTFNSNQNSSTLSYDLALQSDQKIVVASISAVSTSTGLDFGVSRFRSNGIIDSTFGTNGHVITDFESGNDKCYRIKIQNDGRILVAGDVNDDGADAIGLARYLDNLSIGTNDFFLTQKSILIYPNPILDKVNLKYTLENNEEIDLKLLDINGSKIKTLMTSNKKNKGTHSTVIQLNNLTAGYYFLVLSSSKGKAVIKIQKM